MNLSAALRAPQPADSTPALEGLPDWARLAHKDLVACSRMVGSFSLLDESLETYLRLSGPEERCWPARTYWRELAVYMGDARRGRLALARLWPEFLRFRQGRRSASCAHIRTLLLAGGLPRGIDCMHAARCEHCHMFSVHLTASSSSLA